MYGLLDCTVDTGFLAQCQGTDVLLNSRPPGVGLELSVNGMRPYDNYRQLYEDFKVMYVCAPPFGYGENVDNYGGKKVLKFKITQGSSNEFYCVYEETLRDRYGFSTFLSINYDRGNIHTNFDYCIYDSEFIDEVKKHAELHVCLTEIGKIYKLTTAEIIKKLGGFIEKEFNYFQ